MVQKRGKDRQLLYSTPLLALFLLFAGGFFWFFSREIPVKDLTYGELMQILQTDNPNIRFQNVRVGKNVVRGEMVLTDNVSDGSGPDKKTVEVKHFRTRIGLASDAELLKKLTEQAGFSLQGEEDDSVLRNVFSVIFSFLMITGVVIAGVFLFRWVSGGGSPLTFGRSRHRLYAQKDMKITFANVAGIEEAVAELREIVDFLKSADKYHALGGRIPKGVLLVGPPGTGKTLLAKAVAGEADVPFFSMSGSDFVEMFVGVGASRVRDLFSQAESRAPCIIFIDELDALGKTRGGNPAGGHDEREQTLNALLVEMDGFESNGGVIIMAATNRPETLDPALLRPGRFDRTVVVDRPDVMGREAILKVHCTNVKLAEGVDLRHVASLTSGSAGADLANLVNEAALLAARNNRSAVTMAEFNEAVERAAIGLERKGRIMLAEEKRRTAYHEAGHALVACSLPNTDPVHKVTIIPRGVGALGYVWQRPENDRYSHTRTELESRIKVALGGTLAEELIYGEIATGATSDLQTANRIARAMVKEWGMSRLGRVSYREAGGAAFLNGSGYVEGDRYSEKTAREIDLEARRIIDEATEEVRGILKTLRPGLEALAQRLVEREVIDGAELDLLIEEYHPGPRLVPASAAIASTDDPEEEIRQPLPKPEIREGLGH